jgi:hypothetical protein
MNANTHELSGPGSGWAPVHAERKSSIRQAQWLAELNGCPVDFVPLDKETRTHVSTAVMCHHLGRKEQTARGWACHEDGPLRPIRVCGRLAWAVTDIKRLLGV